MQIAPVSKVAHHAARSLMLSRDAGRIRRVTEWLGQGFLFFITSLSVIVVVFIFFYIIRDAIPFFRMENIRTFFFETKWYPSAEPPSFGACSIFVGTFLVTLGAVVVAVPLGISAAVCLSDILPFSARQAVKPVVEVIAAIPSVAFGFFALVIFAPMLQRHGGILLSVAVWIMGVPLLAILIVIVSDWMTDFCPDRIQGIFRSGVILVLTALLGWGLLRIGMTLMHLDISSGANALNVSIILGIMALPTVVSVSEDALQSVGRDLREASYALGATRAETLVKSVIPAASSGICAAVILGVMRAFGETMVVWMASGNAAQIPRPWYNFLEPVRTLTATIAGDMGEADQVTGSSRYHVLFAMAFCLLAISFVMNLISEGIIRRSRKKLGK